MTEITDAISYKLTATEDGTTGTKARHIGVTHLHQTIRGLKPETLYVVEMFADTGSRKV